MNCEQCGKRISRRWTNLLKDGSSRGDYCTKDCAAADAWGPVFRGSKPAVYRLVRSPKSKTVAAAK
jgi:hypothetical protein